MHYSIEPRIFVKGYGFLSFPKNNGKNLSLYQHCRDEPALDSNGTIVDFTNNNITDSFKL